MRGHDVRVASQLRNAVEQRDDRLGRRLELSEVRVHAANERVGEQAEVLRQPRLVGTSPQRRRDLLHVHAQALERRSDALERDMPRIVLVAAQAQMSDARQRRRDAPARRTEAQQVFVLGRKDRERHVVLRVLALNRIEIKIHAYVKEALVRRTRIGRNVGEGVVDVVLHIERPARRAIARDGRLHEVGTHRTYIGHELRQLHELAGAPLAVRFRRAEIVRTSRPGPLGVDVVDAPLDVDHRFRQRARLAERLHVQTHLRIAKVEETPRRSHERRGSDVVRRVGAAALRRRPRPFHVAGHVPTHIVRQIARYARYRAKDIVHDSHEQIRLDVQLRLHVRLGRQALTELRLRKHRKLEQERLDARLAQALGRRVVLQHPVKSAHRLPKRRLLVQRIAAHRNLPKLVAELAHQFVRHAPCLPTARRVQPQILQLVRQRRSL